MALIRFSIRNVDTATTLATEDKQITLTAIQRAFPGTASESAAAALAWMVNELRIHVRQVRRNAKQQEQQALASAAVQADDADFAANEWAE